MSLGIVAPIIIHLWNTQQGKILKVGSVALLTKNAVKSSSSIKLHELLLLLLRCLLIILLAALLSKPQWHSNKSAGKGWVLLDKNDAQQIYNRFKPQVDSLMQAGYELHYFNKGFEKTSLQNALGNGSDTTQNTNYWGTLQQLTATTGNQLALYIFTNDYLNKFRGARPVTSPNVHWYNYTSGDTSIYLAGAYALQGDSAKIITANSSATGTLNTYTANPMVQLQGITVDTSTLYVAIYNKGCVTDAGYVKAAVEAIQQFSRRKIKLLVTDNMAQLSQQLTWLFWLSSDAIPANIKTANVFVYEHGRNEDVQSWIYAMQAQGSTQTPAALYKRIFTTGNDGVIVWSDGFGSPLLTKQANTYHFFSRFDASWNDLPWSNYFPQMVYSLLINNNSPGAIASKDKRIIDDAQLQPYVDKESKTATQRVNTVSDISNIFWLLAFVVFFIERIISSRVKKGAAYA